MNWEAWTMKSKTSFFNPSGLWNRTLFVKNLTRFWPLWGLASFFGGLIPLALITNWLRYDRNPVNPLEFTGWYYEVVAVGVPLVMLCYCILCAMAVWGYLFNSRSVSLMHTLPIRREGLFVTNFLSGMAMVAIPCAVTGLLSVLLSLMCGGFDAKGLAITVLSVAGLGFFYFSAATCTAFVTGNIFAMPLLYFLFQFLAPLLDSLLCVFSGNLIFGLQGRTYSGVVEFFSPTVYLLNHVHAVRSYEQAERILGAGSGAKEIITDSKLTGIALENGWLIGVYVLVGVALLGIAWLCYRMRRSESAGDVISIGWAKSVFQYGVAGLLAIGGGQLLYLIFWEAFDARGQYALIPLIACMVVAGAIGYYAAAMLLAKTLRVFTKKSLPGLGILALCCAVLSSVLYFDTLGISSRIPRDDSLTYVYFHAADNGYYLYPDEPEDLEIIHQIEDFQRSVLADRRYIQNFNWQEVREQEAAYYGETVDNVWNYVDYELVTLVYKLKNGLSIERSYPLNLMRSRMEQPGTFDYLLDELVNSSEMKNRRLHAGDRYFIPDGGDLYVQRRNNNYSLSSRELEELLSALQKDTQAGKWNYVWFDSQADIYYALDLNIHFSVREEMRDLWKLGDRGLYDNIYVRLRPGMDNAIGCLKDMGYLTDKDLVTWSELNEGWAESDVDEIPAVPVPTVRAELPETAETAETAEITEDAA